MIEKHDEVPRDEKKYKNIHGNIDLDERHTVNRTKNTKKQKTEEIPLKEPKNKYKQIDYDIDYQDKRFMKHSDLKIKNKIFELIIDRLEKEWKYFLIKIAIRKKFIDDVADKICDICTLRENNERNLIVVCSGCGLCVHQECYGVPFFNKRWYCKKCLFYGGDVPKCNFCGVSGGAYKETIGGKWGHVLCVLFNPDISFLNRVFLEPIDDSSVLIHKGKKKCDICKSNSGVTISCDFSGCQAKYHVSCGIESALYFDLKNKITYCDIHNPLNKNGHWCINDFRGIDSLSYKPIALQPVIRAPIKFMELKKCFLHDAALLKPKCATSFYKKIMSNDVNKLKMEDKEKTVKSICKYWEMKRALMPNSSQFKIDLLNYEDGFMKWMRTRKI